MQPKYATGDIEYTVVPVAESNFTALITVAGCELRQRRPVHSTLPERYRSAYEAAIAAKQFIRKHFPEG